jgi:hypothetical protein
MQQVKRHMTHRGPVLGIETDISAIEDWRPVVTQVRETILNYHLVGSHCLAERAPLPRKALACMPTQDEVEDTADRAIGAIRSGRLIDFGSWTNDIIKHGGLRGGPLFMRGVLAHPFGVPYVFMHTWEFGTSVYLVNPLEGNEPAGATECIELQPMMISATRVLMIADRMTLHPRLEGGGMAWPGDPNKYYCSAIPSVWRFLPGAEELNQGMPPPNAAAGNVLDPLMTMLLIINTRNIPRETIAVADKLQKARARNGKEPIPPYQRVDSVPYVTAVNLRRAKGKKEPKGGTHASPVFHLRMGHLRHYPNGIIKHIPDALVNATEETKRAFIQGGRTHYTVKPESDPVRQKV